MQVISFNRGSLLGVNVVEKWHFTIKWGASLEMMLFSRPAFFRGLAQKRKMD